MRTTIEYLDAISQRNGGISDYAIAKKLGITRSSVSNYRNHKSFFDDSTALEVAKLLEISPVDVLINIHTERAKKPAEKAAWESALQRLGGVAAALLLGFGVSTAPETAPTPTSHNPAVECVLCKPGKRRGIPFPLAFFLGMRIRPFQ